MDLNEKNIPEEATEVSADEVIEDMLSGKKPKKNKPKKEKKHSFSKAMKSRKTKRGTIAAAIVIVFICIVVLVNVITGILVDKFPSLQFDLTSTHSYGLQSDTTEYLKQVNKDITIYVLAKEATFKNGLGASDGTQYAVQGYNLLKKMAATNDKINLKFLELSSNPTFTNKYSNISWSDDSNYLILIDAGDSNYTALQLDECFTYDEESYQYYGTMTFTACNIEQAVITGVLDVTSSDKVCVDFITGSGESSDYYSDLKSLLKQNAYDVKDVSLTTSKPRDKAEIAILFAPTVDLSDDATEKLQKWLDNDGEYGRTLIYMPTDTEVKTPNIDTIVGDYGMKVSNGLAYCTSTNYYINSPYTFVTDYDSDTYTATLKNSKVPTVVGNSRAITITDSSNVVSMLKVDTSVGVLPFSVDTSKIESESDLDKYSKKSVNLACIGTKSNEDEKKSNVVVFGSYYMFTSNFLNTTSFNNGNYIVNLCNTVTDRGDMGITITTAKADVPELGTITESTTVTMGVIFIGVVPVVVLIIGLVLFIRRRNR